MYHNDTTEMRPKVGSFFRHLLIKKTQEEVGFHDIMLWMKSCQPLNVLTVMNRYSFFDQNMSFRDQEHYRTGYDASQSACHCSHWDGKFLLSLVFMPQFKALVWSEQFSLLSLELGPFVTPQMASDVIHMMYDFKLNRVDINHLLPDMRGFTGSSGQFSLISSPSLLQAILSEQVLF